MIESALSLLPRESENISQRILDTGTPVTAINPVPVDSPDTNTPIQALLYEDQEESNINLKNLLLNIAVYLWLAGMLGLMTYAVLGYLRLKQRMGTAILLRDNIYESDRISTAFVLGLVKPRIYLPLGLANAESILLHEQTHIRRRDYLIKPLAFFALCLHWFNPLVWLAYVLMGKDMEMSCDESVLRRSGEDIRQSYSGSLLTLSEKQSGIPGPLAFGEGHTKSRIKNVLRFRKPALWVSAVAMVLVLGVSIGFAMNRTSDPLPIELRDVQGVRISYAKDGEKASYQTVWTDPDVVQRLAEQFNALSLGESGGRPMESERITVAFQKDGVESALWHFDQNLTVSGTLIAPGNYVIQNTDFDYQYFRSIFSEDAFLADSGQNDNLDGQNTVTNNSPDDETILRSYEAARVSMFWFRVDTMPIGSETRELDGRLYFRVEHPAIQRLSDLRLSDDLQTVTGYEAHDMLLENIDGAWVFSRFTLVR